MLPLLENLTPEQLERVGKYPDGEQYTFKELLKLCVKFPYAKELRNASQSQLCCVWLIKKGDFAL